MMKMKPKLMSKSKFTKETQRTINYIYVPNDKESKVGMGMEYSHFLFYDFCIYMRFVIT